MNEPRPKTDVKRVILLNKLKQFNMRPSAGRMLSNKELKEFIASMKNGRPIYEYRITAKPITVFACTKREAKFKVTHNSKKDWIVRKIQKQMEVKNETNNERTESDDRTTN
jgi:hypothetical protein